MLKSRTTMKAATRMRARRMPLWALLAMPGAAGAGAVFAALDSRDAVLFGAALAGAALVGAALVGAVLAGAAARGTMGFGIVGGCAARRGWTGRRCWEAGRELRACAENGRRADLILFGDMFPIRYVTDRFGLLEGATR
jgi:hypothetical protein